MSDALEEIERRLGHEADLVDGPRRTAAFVAGSQWQASQPVTDAEVEAAARVFYEAQTGTKFYETSIYRDNWVSMARYALEAARAAR